METIVMNTKYITLMKQVILDSWHENEASNTNDGVENKIIYNTEILKSNLSAILQQLLNVSQKWMEQ